MSGGANKIWIIGNRQGKQVTKSRVVLSNYDMGTESIDGFQDPIVVPVYINAQNAYFATKAGFLNQFIDVLASYKSQFRGQVVAPRNVVSLYESDIGRITVDD